MHRVGWGLDEIEVPIEGARLIVLGVNSEGTDAGNVGGLQGPKKCVLQQCRSNASPLPVPANRKAGQKHDWNGMPR